MHKMIEIRKKIKTQQTTTYIDYWHMRNIVSIKLEGIISLLILTGRQAILYTTAK